jgi:hypothetical protein
LATALLRAKDARPKQAKKMNSKKNQQIALTECDFPVDLTLHGFPIDLLEQFAIQIAEPYYGGSLKEAIKELMLHAVAEQELVQNHIRQG